MYHNCVINLNFDTISPSPPLHPQCPAEREILAFLKFGALYLVLKKIVKKQENRFKPGKKKGYEFSLAAGLAGFE